MEHKIRVGAVSYLNTKPLLYGIHRSPVMEQIELVLDYPSSIAKQLVDGQIDIGLVPVAIIPFLQQHFIVGDHCIGAIGPVASVCIFSEVPMEQIETVLLDYQSRTSVALALVLLKKFWKKKVMFEAAKPGYQQQIMGTTAGVVIGDRAFEQRTKSKYVFDLAEAWIGYTGLPFVFAAWIANKPLPESFTIPFNAANAVGLEHLNEVMVGLESPFYDLQTYYTKNIDYGLDEEKQKGLKRFLEELKG